MTEVQIENYENQPPEKLVLSILQRENQITQQLWDQIDHEMSHAMTVLASDLGLGLIKRGLMKLYWKYVSRKMLQAAEQGKSLEEIEEIVASITSKVGNEDVKIPFLQKRADRSFDLIEKYLHVPSVLDFGCGDGLLAGVISQHNYFVQTADVLDYRLTSDLPFLKLSPTNRIDLEDNAVNTTIAWTVLHHCDHPEREFGEIARITSDRIIIVEGFVEDPKTRLLNCFYDWYANRPGKNLDINVPYSYRTTAEWQKIFAFHGWIISESEYLGIDEPVVPERHILYILEPQI